MAYDNSLMMAYRWYLYLYIHIHIYEHGFRCAYINVYIHIHISRQIDGYLNVGQIYQRKAEQPLVNFPSSPSSTAVFSRTENHPSPSHVGTFVSTVSNYFNLHCLPTVSVTFGKPKEVLNLSSHCILRKASLNLLYNGFSVADILMQGGNYRGSWTMLVKVTIIILISEWYRWILGVKYISGIIAQETTRNPEKALVVCLCL